MLDIAKKVYPNDDISEADICRKHCKLGSGTHPKEAIEQTRFDEKHQSSFCPRSSSDLQVSFNLSPVLPACGVSE